MKIDLNQRVNTDFNGKTTTRLGDVFENALFSASPTPEKKDIFKKVQSKEEAELTVEELAEVLKAIKEIYIGGIYWAVEEIVNK